MKAAPSDNEAVESPETVEVDKDPYGGTYVGLDGDNCDVFPLHD